MQAVDPLVACAVLAASLLHASWHAMVKATGDRVVALAGMNVVSTATAIALLPFAKVPAASTFLILCGSVLLHGAYKLLIARLYGQSDLSQAYPLARGFTPLFATLIAVIALDELPDGPAQIGILAVCIGIGLLAFEKRGYRVSGQAMLTALFAGLAVAAYSVLDAYGIRRNGDWFSFTVWLLLLDGGAFVGYALVSRGASAVNSWSTQWQRTAVSGFLGIASFAVFMWALGRAPVGAVSAMRETSVLFAALLGMIVLRERATWLRHAAAFSVVTGVAAIAVGR